MDEIIKIGVPAELAFGRLLQNRLFGLSIFDLLTFEVSILAIGIVGAPAGYVPARRASRVDPLVALRYE